MFFNILRDIELALVSFNETPIFPSDYQGSTSSQTEFCRYTVLPSTGEVYASDRAKITAGITIIDIFVPAGKGQSRPLQIADALDTLLQNKVLTNRTELGVSFLNYEGQDPVNKSLTRYKYTIPFKFYGE